MRTTVAVRDRGIHLSTRDALLVVSREGDVLDRIPVEDIDVVSVESLGVTITSAAVATLLDAGVVLLLAGKDHLPAGMLMPFARHWLTNERLRSQVGCPEPLRKQLWLRIVRAKLRMQSLALQEHSPGRTRLLSLADRVRSGDPANVEAQGARVYWSQVFTSEIDRLGLPAFRRRRDGNPPNGLLNYGYAVLRAAVARGICQAGLHPGLGLAHANRSNPYCLADDLMEGYRPVVDLRVRELLAAGSSKVDPDTKANLLGILSDRVELPEGSFDVTEAIGRTASSLSTVLMDAYRGREEKSRREKGKAISSAREFADGLVLPGM